MSSYEEPPPPIQQAAPSEEPYHRRIPVTCLTGFLGAGKTTLLNHLLHDAQPHGYRFALIENEFGAIPIDNDLLASRLQTPEHLEVVNGCVCCNVRGDLIMALESLWARRSVLKFDAVLIETTGIADPGPIVQTFFIEENIKDKYELDAVLTVVDAKQILMRLAEPKPDGVENEALQQILYADQILLNKMDLVSSQQELDAVYTKIRELHPTVSIVPCTKGQVDPRHLVGLNCFNLERICQIIKPDFAEDEYLEFTEKHDSDVTSVACEVEGELDIALFENWVKKLIGDIGAENLYRYKGVLALDDDPRKYIFQGVGMVFDGDFSPYMYWAPGETRVNRFVFIGKGLDHDYLKAGFEHCQFQERRQLRFEVGTFVLANIGGHFEPGVVIGHWERGNPYRIRLYNRIPPRNEIFAPLDIDRCVQLHQEGKRKHDVILRDMLP